MIVTTNDGVERPLDARDRKMLELAPGRLPHRAHIPQIGRSMKRFRRTYIWMCILIAVLAALLLYNLAAGGGDVTGGQAAAIVLISAATVAIVGAMLFPDFAARRRSRFARPPDGTPAEGVAIDARLSGLGIGRDSFAWSDVRIETLVVRRRDISWDEDPVLRLILILGERRVVLDARWLDTGSSVLYAILRAVREAGGARG